ncbi:EscU/YscU/HrcU family type III secretion system export apparatus switch protein [Priestia endophytica]|uniref:EscU/YscU/HrcU family type III secretion system export apparatus switch protein n=1 Tax=Priestia endophytica TaxID=135735 RepID=UPI00203CA08C|nr:EscU/YscU/HrcU family type III secretion system export apparatus switch protein [Priestia endophytica]MCM3539296.1 EscU/YscU/HrcU family type III secretion system export apparatus switch protein [Priestia endophytica]
MKKESYSKKAVALAYLKHEKTPKVVAKGGGDVAKDIIEKAKENNIPIQEDPSLVNLLHNLELNERIPEELYEAVAEIFAFIYKMDEKAKK